MSSKNGTEILLQILPKDYEFHFYGVSVREFSEKPNEVKIDAYFRINVHDERQFEKFIEDFSRNCGSCWNKKNRMDRKGKNLKLPGIRKCIHNVVNTKVRSEND